MTRPECWILILDGYKLWNLWPAGLDFYRWSTGELSWPFGGKNIYLYLGFFENRKNSGLTSGQNDDPLTRAWKMIQMTHWPGDPMTKFHVWCPQPQLVPSLYQKRSLLTQSVVGRSRWSVVFENGGDNSLFHADGIIILPIDNKKLSYRRVTARCVLSVVILPITTQQCRNYLYDDKSWPNRWYEVGGLVGGNVS